MHNMWERNNDMAFMELMRRGVVALEGIYQVLKKDIGVTPSVIYTPPRPASVYHDIFQDPQFQLNLNKHVLDALNMDPQPPRASFQVHPEILAKPEESLIENTFKRSLEVQTKSKIFKLYLCSASNDMSDEKRVFYSLLPKLNDFCVKRGIGIDICDFSKSGEDLPAGKRTFDYVLHEIDECRPHFIGLVGQKYGKCRTGESSDEKLNECFTAAMKRHPWIEKYTDRSLFEIELCYGALFYPQYAKNAIIFVKKDQNEEGNTKLEALKGLIRSSGVEVKEGWERREMEQLLWNYLTSAVLRDFPEEEVNKEKDEKVFNEFIAKEKGQLIDNPELHTLLERHVNSTTETPLVITGKVACGKTVALHSFLHNRLKESSITQHKIPILPVYIGPNAKIDKIVSQIIRFIKNEFNIDKALPSHKELSVSLTEWLLLASKKGKMVLVIDGLNEMNTSSFSWLPAIFPANIRVIISCTLGTPVHKLITSSQFAWKNNYTMSPFTNSEKRTLCEVFMERSHAKPLTHNETHQLVSSSSTDDPLFLRSVLDRLVIASKTKDTLLPDVEKYLPLEQPKKLFEVILGEMEKNEVFEIPYESTSLVPLSLSLLYLSNEGLNMYELAKICKIDNSACWVTWREQLGELVYDGLGGLIKFNSELFRQVVKEKYLSPSVEVLYRKMISSYFRGQGNSERKLTEYPWQLLKLEDSVNMRDYLSDITVFMELYKEDRKKDFLDYWKVAAVPKSSISSFYSSALDGIARKLNPKESGDMKHKVATFLLDINCTEQAISLFFETLELYQKAQSNPSQEIDLMIYITSLLQTLPNTIEKSLPLVEKCLEMCALFEESEVETYKKYYDQCIHLKASIHFRAKNYDQSVHFYKMLLSSDSDNPKYTKEIADVYTQQNHLDKAESLYTQALAKNRQLFGNTHNSVLECLKSLAKISKEKMNYEQALNYFNEIAELAIHLNLDEEILAEVDSNLGDINLHLSDFPAALKSYQKTLRFQEKKFGNSHSSLSTTLSALSLVSKKLGDVSSAINYAERASNVSQLAYGNNDVRNAELLNQLAACYVEAAQYNKAEELSLKAMEINTKILGADHKEIAENLMALGQIEKKRGDYKQALQFYEKGLDIVTKSYGKAHKKVAQFLHDLGMIHRKLREFPKSLDCYTKSLNLNEKLFGFDSPEVANSLNGLGILKKLCGDLDEACSLHTRAKNIYEKAVGPDHALVAGTLNLLGEVYRKQGKYDYETEKIYLKAIEINKKAFGDSHPEVAENLNGLAQVYRFQMNYSKAEPLYLQSISISEQTLGPSHRHVRNRYNNLASLYESTGRLFESVAIRDKIRRITKEENV